MKKLLLVLISLIAFAASSEAALNSSSGYREIPTASSEYGTIPANYQQKIKEFVRTSSNFKNAETAKFKFWRPFKAYANDPATGKVVWKGYVAYLRVKFLDDNGKSTGWKDLTLRLPSKDGDIYQPSFERVFAPKKLSVKIPEIPEIPNLPEEVTRDEAKNSENKNQ